VEHISHEVFFSYLVISPSSPRSSIPRRSGVEHPESMGCYPLGYSPTAGRTSIPTRLTQQHRREAKGGLPAPTVSIPKPDRLCRGCGTSIRDGRTDCAKCAVEGATKRLIQAAQIGRIAAHTPEALAKEGKAQRQQAKARSTWRQSNQPTWLTSDFYSEKIQPRLAEVSTSAVASRIGVSRWYAGRIRRGYRPHPRHWKALAQLVGVSAIT
jgi:hypothetical protein